MEKNEIQELIHKAFLIAEVAANAFLKAHPGMQYPCGFSSVVIRPATGPLVKELKKMKIGQRGYYGGWSVWNPSKNPTQLMEAKEAGARAFAKVLKEAGFRCEVISRLD